MRTASEPAERWVGGETLRDSNGPWPSALTSGRPHAATVAALGEGGSGESCGRQVHVGGKIHEKLQIVGHVVFSGELDPDPDAAEIDLRFAGYTVATMPDRLRPLLYDPQDYFLKAYVDVSIDVDNEPKVTSATMDEKFRKSWSSTAAFARNATRSRLTLTRKLSSTSCSPTRVWESAEAQEEPLLALASDQAWFQKGLINHIVPNFCGAPSF